MLKHEKIPPTKNIWCRIVKYLVNTGNHMSQLNFEYTQKELQTITNLILEKALKLGATSAQVEISENIAGGVDILNKNIENFETSYGSSMSIQVYKGYNRGTVGISKINPNNIDDIINHALDIAKYTKPDPYNGIAEELFLCKSINQNLELFNPVDINHQQIINSAKEIEHLGTTLNTRIKNSDGASIGYGKYNFILANTNGFNLGYQTTRYNKSLCLIGETKNGMQTDSWYDSSLDFNDLMSNQSLAQTAIDRTVRRLNNGKIKSGVYSVIFESGIAKSFIGNFLGAISGNNLFRHLTFLDNSLGMEVFPKWFNMSEDPFIKKGSRSCYFDNEGVKVSPRELVKNGSVNGYLLNSYSARKLGLKTTGNAGGNHNISVTTNFSGDIYKFAKTLNTGLIIIEIIGHGLNMVTGDYSVGASGLWVENGEIKFFVDNLTVAGNLKHIYSHIRYISDDYSKNSSILCGSMLVDEINISA
jgi:PmbA protein